MNNKKNKKQRGGLVEFFTPLTIIVIIFLVYGVLASINKSFNPMEWWRKWESSDSDNNDGLIYNSEDPTTNLPKPYKDIPNLPNLGGGKLLKKFRRK